MSAVYSHAEKTGYTVITLDIGNCYRISKTVIDDCPKLQDDLQAALERKLIQIKQSESDVFIIPKCDLNKQKEMHDLCECIALVESQLVHYKEDENRFYSYRHSSAES
jgi:hypothetical protein